MSDKWYISGPLGIGTEPDRSLHVTDGGANLRFGSEADVAVFRVENTKPAGTTAVNLQSDAQAWQLRVDGSDGQKFQIFDAKAIRSALTIDTSGNVGIGTTSPSAGLEIDKGATNDVALHLNSSGPGWGSGMQLRNTAQGGRSYGIYSGSGALHFTDLDASVDRLLIDSSGNVGIGTATPSETLEVNGRIKAMTFLGDGSMLSGLPGAKAAGIATRGIDVRTNAVDVGSVSIVASVSGFVVVRFDGGAVASVGDTLVLAASNDSRKYGLNDGNVSIDGQGDRKLLPFSHSRFYSVPQGRSTFYAVAHNFVNTGGTGLASIYGTLTVEFFPREL